MSESVTPDLIRELHTAAYGSHLAVLSRDADGHYRVEPDTTAADHGREVVQDAASIEDWSDGQAMTEDDYAQYALELSAELSQRRDA